MPSAIPTKRRWAMTISPVSALVQSASAQSQATLTTPVRVLTSNMFGVYLGKFSAIVCSKCNESFTDSETTLKIQEIAKEKGIWGLGSNTKITKTGNSLSVRIPKKLADYLKLNDGEEVYIHPDGDRIIVESKP